MLFLQMSVVIASLLRNTLPSFIHYVFFIYIALFLSLIDYY